MIRSVIFDMDGLMVDTERLSLSCWRQAFAAHGLPFSDEILLAGRGADPALTRRRWRDFLGHDYDWQSVSDLKKALFRAVTDREGMPVKPGLLTLLDFLKENGYACCLATSTEEERARQYLSGIGAWDYFDARVFGPMFEHYKPAPDIFCKAAALLATPPADCLVLEDSPNGIRAAAAAGAKAMMIPDLTPVTADLAPLLYASGATLLDVIDLLRAERGQTAFL